VNIKYHISDSDITEGLLYSGFKRQCHDEGRLILAELLIKSSAGYYNSHTESIFLKYFHLQNKNRTANKKGREFLCSMMYNHSNLKPECYELMKRFRADK
jgi:hypothetical protein